MALVVDYRRPLSKPRVDGLRSKATHCVALGSIVSSFTFILALVIGVL